MAVSKLVWMDLPDEVRGNVMGNVAPSEFGFSRGGQSPWHKHDNTLGNLLRVSRQARRDVFMACKRLTFHAKIDRAPLVLPGRMPCVTDIVVDSHDLSGLRYELHKAPMLTCVRLHRVKYNEPVEVSRLMHALGSIHRLETLAIMLDTVEENDEISVRDMSWEFCEGLQSGFQGHLRHLVLSNALCNGKLPESLRLLSALQHLELTNMTAPLVDTYGAVASLTGLTQLTLRSLNNADDDEGDDDDDARRALGATLNQLKSLRRLLLHDIEVDKQMMLTLPPTLDHLYIDTCDVGSLCGVELVVEELLQTLATHGDRMQLLCLYSHEGLLERASPALVASTLGSMTALKSLSLCNMYEMDDELRATLWDVLSQLSALRHLELGGEMAPHVKSLVPALRQLTGLEHLKMTDCNMDDRDAAMLASAIRHLPVLQGLFLYDNNFGSDGLAHLCDAMTRLAWLEEVDICQNPGRIGRAGLIVMREAVKRMPSLKRLCISHSHQGDADLANTICAGYDTCQGFNMYKMFGPPA